MNKRTKKPKSVKVDYKEYKHEVSSYTCPSCAIEYIGAGLSRNVTRFKCECGQELIVESEC